MAMTMQAFKTDRTAFFESLPASSAAQPRQHVQHELNSTLDWSNQASIQAFAAKAASQHDQVFLNQQISNIRFQTTLLSAALNDNTVTLEEAVRNQYVAYLLYCEAMSKAYENNRGQSIFAINLIHDHLGMLHAYRIMTSFGVFTTKLVFDLLQSIQLLDSLYPWLHPYASYLESMRILNAPAMILNILSVALLATRFIIEICRILKHTFFPTDAEKKATAYARFCHELNKYGFNLFNDLLWCTLNAMSNFPELFHITPLFGSYLALVGLAIDVLVLSYRYHITRIELEDQLFAIQTDTRCTESIKKAQLNALSVERAGNLANLEMSLVAAATLVLGAGLFIMLPLTVTMPIGTFLCIFGAGIYLSAQYYAEYKKAIAQEKLLVDSGLDINCPQIKALKETQNEAIQNGLSKFAKDVCLPILFISTIALCWPIGLALLMSYVLCEFVNQTPKKPEQLTHLGELSEGQYAMASAH